MIVENLPVVTELALASTCSVMIGMTVLMAETKETAVSSFLFMMKYDKLWISVLSDND